MSKYAQIITSFERTGNFPLEANYIFPSVDSLKAFYSDPIQAATLHKGLLRIVEANEEGLQALYWVTKKQTNDELEFTELIAGSNIVSIKKELEDLLNKLEEEIKERKAGDKAIWGLEDPSDIEEKYNSINDLANELKALDKALKKLEEESVSGDNSLKKQLKALVGTEDNDIIEYLKSLPYQTVTEMSKMLDRIVNGTLYPEDGETEETEIIDNFKDLEAFLAGFTTKDTLMGILTKLWFNIQGEILPSKDFRTLRGIEDFLIKFTTIAKTNIDTLREEVNNIERGVGLNADGLFSPDAETTYLRDARSIQHALQILDKVLYRYASATTPSVRNTDEALHLSITQELDSYVLSAALKLSSHFGNQLVKKNDGLYYHAKTYYEDGVLTFRVNDQIISQHYLGLDAIVKDARYDKDNELLIFEFKLQNGDIQTVKIPVGALIREWEPYNRDTSAVVLERIESISGTDQLLADVRISNEQWNILQKVDGALYVKGLTDNIYHKGALLETYLDSFAQATNKSIEDLLNKLEEAKQERTSLRSAINKEIEDRKLADESLDTRLKTTEGSLANTIQNLNTEKEERQNKDNEIVRSLDKEVDRAKRAEEKLQSDLNSEVTRSSDEDAKIRIILQTVTELLKAAGEKDIELENKINNITHDEYTIRKESTPNNDCVATYVLLKNGDPIGNAIDIPEVPVDIKATYVDGQLTLIVNGVTVGIFDLGLASLVKDSYYDESNDELVIEYNLHNNKTQVIRTSFRNLIDKIKAEIKKVQDAVDGIQIPEYSLEKQVEPEVGCVATYYLTKDGNPVGQKVNIPQETGLSNEVGNQLVLKQDGFFYKVNATYENGVLSIFANDSLVNTFNLGVSSIVSDSYYDSTAEDLVLTFNLVDGTQQVIRINVHNLIQEWKTVNEGHTVEITRKVVINGPDEVTADVKISTHEARNILQSDSTGLYVRGDSDNITHSGQTLNQYLEQVKQEYIQKIEEITNMFKDASDSRESLQQNINQEIQDRQQADKELEQKISEIKISEYKIAKQGIPESGCVATYILTKDGEPVGEQINVPQETGLSVEQGNQIVKKTDGYYLKINTTCENGVLTFYVNDTIVGSHNLGVSSMVYDSYYDSSTEELVMIYNLVDGTQQTVRISASALIQEWKVVNEGHTVTLTKTRVVNGQDELSADVNISTGQDYNILQKDGIGLFVKGIADNIATKANISVQAAIDLINEALIKKAPLDSPILTGIPQVLLSPDPEDSSQRIPSTAWVKARINEALTISWIEIN